MKKALIIFAALATVIPLVVAICIFGIPWVYYRVYPFDRITGEYEITVNGKEINAVVDEYYEIDGEGKVRLTSDSKKFKIKGNTYDVYKIGFIVSGDDLYKATNDSRLLDYDDVDLAVNYFKTNKWSIADIDIDIDLVEENGEWYVLFDIEYYWASGEYMGHLSTTSKHSQKVKLEDLEKEKIFFGNI